MYLTINKQSKKKKKKTAIAAASDANSVATTPAPQPEPQSNATANSKPSKKSKGKSKAKKDDRDDLDKALEELSIKCVASCFPQIFTLNSLFVLQVSRIAACYSIHAIIFDVCCIPHFRIFALRITLPP